MKKKKILLGLLPVLLLLLLFWAGGTSLSLFGGNFETQQVAEAASTSYAYSLELNAYDLTFDVNKDRTMHVTEVMTVAYTGTSNTGFYRDIPVNDGDRVSSIQAWEVKNGTPSYVDYTVEMDEEDASFISLNIGDNSRKSGTTHIYRIEYDYAMTDKEGANLLSLNVVGFGSEIKMQNISVTLNLPSGLIPDETVCYVCASNEATADITAEKVTAGNTTFTLKRRTSDSSTNFAFDYQETSNGLTVSLKYTGVLNEGSRTRDGITFDFSYQSGVLSTHTDFMPYLFLLGSILLLAIVFLLKKFMFNKTPLIPVVNVTAPNDMDPLMMGKLIDNKVNNEDVTSLIYYWANKGYLAINLEQKDDPVLIRIVQRLPEGTPSYQVKMFQDLFARGEVVKVSSLANKFYSTVDMVKAEVNIRAKGLFSSHSVTTSVVLALLAGLFVGLVPILYAKLTIHITLSFYWSLVFLILGFAIYGITETAMYYRYKSGNKKFALRMVGIALLCVLFTALYVVIIPEILIPKLPLALVTLLGFATIIYSVWLINRTDSYNKTLGDIIGFRNFILYAEKDRLEAMLEEEPNFYYNVLPYAQVLGVSDIWEKKFASLTVMPPRWLAGTYTDFVSTVVITRALTRSSMAIARNMVSRPSSSGKSGGMGGSFGGSAGGGHGGGGFRGR